VGLKMAKMLSSFLDGPLVIDRDWAFYPGSGKSPLENTGKLAQIPSKFARTKSFLII